MTYLRKMATSCDNYRALCMGYL